MAARAGSGGGWTPPNKRMHATRDTNDVMLSERFGRARDARRSASSNLSRSRDCSVGR